VTELRRKPDRTHTSDVNEYLDAWMEYAAPILNILHRLDEDWRLAAFDPDLLFALDGDGMRSLSFDVDPFMYDVLLTAYHMEPER
jgi:hypothetical protein